VRYHQLDRLDKFPTFIRYPADWHGKALLLSSGLILAKGQDPGSCTNDPGCSRNSFYDFASFHTCKRLFSPQGTLRRERAMHPSATSGRDPNNAEQNRNGDDGRMSK
jgi:hypothetical protein